MPHGLLALVLHAHLPFVRHPEYQDFLEEDWLFEAITETYIPLLDVFNRLERDGVDWRLTMSITPTLAAMLADPLLQFRYVRHLDNLLRLTGKELHRTRWQPEFQRLARMYHDHFQLCRHVFINQLEHRLLEGFRRHFASGRLELIASAATHAFLPLMDGNVPAMRAQIEIGCREFERHFGRRPRGLWLPECGFVDGVDRLLGESGVRFFFTDGHGVLHAEPRPRFGVYAPIRCPQSGVAVFGRDHESSRQVWSSVEGYPGDSDYRDFYRDVAFDLDYDYLKPHLHSTGIRSSLGIKYHRITGEGDRKEVYDPDLARTRASQHADHFLESRLRQIDWLAPMLDSRPPLIVAPYDAELFGHWWHEGPQWLEFLLRRIAADSATIRLIGIAEYLELVPTIQTCQPPMCSWGNRGYNGVWLEESNHWIYPHLHAIAERMVELAHGFPHADGVQRRALNQAAREVLLAQSSDWAFIMKTGTLVEYATYRVRTHVVNFVRLAEQIARNAIDETNLVEIEERHNLFPNLDYRVFAK